MIWPHAREWALRLLGAVRGRKQLEQDLEDELAFHAAMREAKYAERGMATQEAARKTRHVIGGIEQWKEALRDVRRPRALENLASDLKLAIRLLRKSPAFTIVALVTLTLAIGANTSVFTLLDTLLLKPLPVPQADRLAMLRMQPVNYGYFFNYPEFRSLETEGSVFSSVFAFGHHRFHMRGSDGTETISGELVSGKYFSTLRVSPEKGRWLTSADDQLGGGPAGPVAVISDRFWKTSFNGDPAIIGRKITLDHVVFTVAGVMPAGFHGAEVDTRPDIFVPLSLEPMVDAPYNAITGGWHAWWLKVGARLRDGVSLRQANAFLRKASKAVFSAAPNLKLRFNGVPISELYIVAEAGAKGFSDIRLQFQKPLWIVMILVIMVLLVACLNLASLLLARSAGREREFATRFALGAARRRLLQQLLTESLLLATVGTILGLLASQLASRLLVLLLTRRNESFQFNVAPDVRVFAFAACIAVLTTLLIGIVPALKFTGRSLQDRVQDASVSLRSAERRHIWPRVLMGSEIALALVLITGAGLLGYSLIQLRNTSVGFDPAGLAMLPLDMMKQSRDGKALIQFYEEFARQVRSLKRVDSASYGDMMPLSGSTGIGEVSTPGGSKHQMFDNQVGPRYFATMKTSLLAGREFLWTDTDESGRKAILNQSAARILFPGRDPVGQHVLDGEKNEEVVGIVADAKYANLRDPAPPTVYTPMTQDLMHWGSFTLVFRSTGRPGPVIAAADSILRRLAPEVPIPGALSMEQQISNSLATERLVAMLASFFAVSSLLITAIGLYGTLAYSTERRTGEIGIRMALGAQRGNIVGLVLKENAAIVICGCALGLVLSLACARFIASFLYGVHANSPLVLGVSFVLLLLVGFLASLIPALRASRIDPMAAIRHE